MWFHLENYPAMYLKVPIIISNLLDTDYFDIQDLKLIEIYEKTKTEEAVIRVWAVFNNNNPLSLSFHVPILESEEQWVPFLYEQMPMICYQCAKIGHHYKDCTTVIAKPHDQEPNSHALIYSSKMSISPRALENRNRLFHAFANSTEYMRDIQISKLIIKVATQTP